MSECYCGCGASQDVVDEQAFKFLREHYPFTVEKVVLRGEYCPRVAFIPRGKTGVNVSAYAAIVFRCYSRHSRDHGQLVVLGPCLGLKRQDSVHAAELLNYKVATSFPEGQVPDHWECQACGTIHNTHSVDWAECDVCGWDFEWS